MAALAAIIFVAALLALTGRRLPEPPLLLRRHRRRQRLTRSPPCLSRPAPAVSGELRALLERPEAQKQDEAWGGLYRLWGIRVGAGEHGCAQALVRGLDCLRGEGGLEQLRRLNRPAIVRVYDSEGSPRWLVLERLQGRQATLAAGGETDRRDIDKLAGYDISEFVLFWRPPARTGGRSPPGTMAPGSRGW